MRVDQTNLSPTCLIVDDEPAILRLVSIVLRHLGCVTLAASNAEAALELLENVKPDLIITDVRMPSLDGTELARHIKENDKLAATPVLLMSAYGEPRGHRGDDFIAKPFDIDALTDFVVPYIQRETA